MEGRRMIMVIAPKPGVVRKAQEARKAALAAAQLALLAQKKDQPAGKRPVTENEEDELDEDAINADVDEDEDDEAADEAAKA
jgi:hypothetical protein